MLIQLLKKLCEGSNGHNVQIKHAIKHI